MLYNFSTEVTEEDLRLRDEVQVVCSSNVDNADPLKCCAWINDRSSEVLEFATGGIDSGLTIWRWNSEVNKKPVPLYSLRGHHGSVETVTAATENVICSAGQDKKINIWREISKAAETPEETRFFTAQETSGGP